MITIAIVSDVRVYGEGLAQALSSSDTLQVVSIEGSVENAVTTLKQYPTDAALLDMRMDASCRLAATLVQACPATKLLALAMPKDENHVFECVEAGIAGYVPKEASTAEVIDAITRVKNGEFYCPPEIAACIFSKVRKVAKDVKTRQPPTVNHDEECLFAGLTKRERQIVSLLADGLSNKQISRELNIEVSTVKNHVHNTLVKLGVKSRTQAVSLLQRLSRHSFSESLDLDHRLEVL
ncbi:response regulator transcription factor [Exilibacterium tricleocarpae]|uniref:Response regulator transcription factor n=1 Tax=Exilibacterium tricleocarpae TaxID=2591008 RepID=A0A545U8F8_9GAMM|nr:response regulator transcription factor [Exilibacterium tricleocarpae]TQV85751.1 response regulator transcription factor [Exilibacterium tricleocarpae]